MEMRVVGLYVYPIKSCRGIPVARTQVSLRGFRYDREWMLVGRDGNFLSQRTHPRMCLIETALTNEWLEVRAPGMPLLRLSLEEEAGALVEAMVHKKPCKGVDQGVWPAAWFTAFLGQECFLLRAPPESLHVRRSKDGRALGFADGYECLLISTGSMADLNSRLPAPVSINRFRPNIVVSGCEPYAEDAWEEISVASVRFLGGPLCVRCAIVTTEQTTGDRGKEPLATLAAYRKTPEGVVFGRNFSAGNGGQIDFGSLVDIAPPR